MEPFSVCNWNIAGAKFLELPREAREQHRDQIHKELGGVIGLHKKPQVLTLQEVVRFGSSPETAEDIIRADVFPDYSIHVFPLIDTHRLSSNAKWQKVIKRGGWDAGTYFAQGNAMMFRNDTPHSPVWDLRSFPPESHPNRHFIEQVNLESGLYFGDRDTEPRAILVSHFIVRTPEKDRPLDIFVVSVHLTTLTGEREGIPEVDVLASRIRMSQLDVVFTGIISRYNSWRQRGYLVRGEKWPLREGETDRRYPPVWVLAGDFNFTPESLEYQAIHHMNFMDIIPQKGTGTKASGLGRDATLTLDYVFAGPKFISLDPLIIQGEINSNRVNHHTTVSDHYPMVAKVPLAMHVFGMVP